ncbi:hypothetical protein, partial [Burkholderia pseudomallei]|uniref:hypothetical protein n=1 Tax=Burkholderia pseudomallei TaxID=28450 RepID=UPI0011AEDE29
MGVVGGERPRHVLGRAERAQARGAAGRARACALGRTVIWRLAPGAARAVEAGAAAGDRRAALVLGEACGRLALGDATLTSCESR